MRPSGLLHSALTTVLPRAPSPSEGLKKATNVLNIVFEPEFELGVLCETGRPLRCLMRGNLRAKD
jgi:hypothetical protein